MMSTIPSCMGQYINQYMIAPGQQPGYYRPQGVGAGNLGGQQHHNYMVGCYQNANGWAGVPLISTATRRPRKQQQQQQFQQQNRQNNDFDENAMTRLALHAHGAPLILAGRYWNNKTVNQRQNQQNLDVIQQQPQQQINLIDECSSSSSSTSSLTTGGVTVTQEMCLPRIIKPRKRRKKDRKPVVGQQDEEIIKLDTTAIKTIETSIDSIKLTPDDLISSCSCRLCDPYCKIWAFPLRRSCSDNSAEIVQQKVKDVGVIGSNRLTTVRNEWRSQPHSINDSIDYTNSRKGSFSDSGDSGCDILSGINFTDDILCCSTSIDNEDINFNLNELTKKLQNSLDIKSDSDSCSVFSDCVFNDSDIDPVVNSLISGTNLIFNNINNNQSIISEPLVFVQEKDMGSEIYNCFDMVWNGEQNLSIV